MQVIYPDKKIRLIAIPFLGLIFRHIGEPSPLITLLRSPTYYIDLGVSILVLGLLWQYNRWVFVQLDKQYSWLTKPTERFVLQFFLGIGVSLLLVTMVSFVYNEFIIKPQRTPEFDITILFVTDVPVSFLIFLSIHLLYALLYIRQVYEAKLQALQRIIETSEEKPEPAVRNIMAYQGKALVPVPLQEVAYFYKAKDLTFLRTFAGKDYAMDETLEYFENSLPEKSFFRLNRQMLTHMNAVKKFSSDGTGRLLLHLEPTFKEEVYVSRRRSPEFQAWMREVTV
ncbi:hypothetical protein AHMF7605_15030 [Adhaeribacter arboris]|uniref:HTH LytTR-type domain-containing protein n=1 Tax=Adhaeribacter arboris TaxID=2072846 RepID=A0A2T2YGS6_9BACT|nr:LytTR family DNA-binding domain-containing protein [Adhaeribacter arboris]PSR54726.1 hypothetical protein AHMF7605_15030 [Adhaeribacter arboris]